MGRLTFNSDRLVYSTKYKLVNTNQYIFSSMMNVAKYVADNETDTEKFDKVIFVLRHSIRPRNDWSPDVKLTPLGVNAAKIAGQSLQTLPGELGETGYYSTKVTRTDQTAFFIAEGRGVEQLRTLDDVKDMSTVSTSLNFIKDEDTYNNYVALKGYNATWYDYMYNGSGTGSAFNDMYVISDNFINSVLNNATLTKNSIMISHDQNVMPLVVASLNKAVDFRINECWLNYLSGIVILKKGNTTSIIPVSGLPSGYN